MRRLVATLSAIAAFLLAGSVAWKADAQTSRGAIFPAEQDQNFSPIRQAACGPFWGEHCRPFHHWVCGPYGRRWWCARC
jgi:hypothetical protein